MTQCLHDMAALSRVLKDRRLEQGSLDFDLPEVTFAYNKVGELESIQPKPRLSSHSLVEEFMLVANQAAVLYFEALLRKQAQLLPFVYRIHDRPDPAKLKDFFQFTKMIGIKVAPSSHPSPKVFQRILQEARGQPDERLIGELTLRTMQKAMYSTQNVGHFGLAFSKYTHFTSPIRRYPDLLVHRLLKEYVVPVQTERAETVREGVPRHCKHSSDMERRALEAEREAIKIKQLEYMESRVGEVFRGIISGVTNFGMFVEIDGILVEGLVHLRELADDHYLLEPPGYTLKGRRSGKVYRLGDQVTVQVIRVDRQEGHLDFNIADGNKQEKKRNMKAAEQPTEPKRGVKGPERRRPRRRK